MLRKVIHIHSEKCDGCGKCIDACHENAIILENNKAKLLAADYCDGLGDCLPACPKDAIEITLQDVNEFNEQFVLTRKTELENFCQECVSSTTKRKILIPQKRNFPIQLELVNPSSEIFQNAKLLIACDCSAFIYPEFHQLIEDRILLIACPKLYKGDYSVIFKNILTLNTIKDILLVRMTVPCCSKLPTALIKALDETNQNPSIKIFKIPTNGEII